MFSHTCEKNVTLCQQQLVLLVDAIKRSIVIVVVLEVLINHSFFLPSNIDRLLFEPSQSLLTSSLENVDHLILFLLPPLQAEPALIYDSVNVFAKGLHALERSATLSLANLSCESETPWPDGSSLFNYINAVSFSFVFALF